MTRPDDPDDPGPAAAEASPRVNPGYAWSQLLRAISSTSVQASARARQC